MHLTSFQILVLLGSETEKTFVVLSWILISNSSLAQIVNKNHLWGR